jgi:ribulose-phosphate 3-epimerase
VRGIGFFEVVSQASRAHTESETTVPVTVGNGESMTDRRVRVVPALLTDSAAALSTMVSVAAGLASFVQVDVMDGQFVPARSITADDLQSTAMPFDWEAHLMVQCPEMYFAPMKRAGAQRVIFHEEASGDPVASIRAARELGLDVGLALNPETPVDTVLHLLHRVDVLLLLAVTPGYYGSPFVPAVLDKVRELRTLAPALEIEVDGGVKESNIGDVVRSGADSICVGSAIFLQPEPPLAYERLVALAGRAASGRSDDRATG